MTTSMTTALPLLLVVDDMADNLSLMVNLLRPHYRVKVANSGPRALELAAAAPQPDLILLDIMMPGMDGYEVCRRLKAAPATAAIPVIFLTAKAEVDDEAQGLAMGVVDYITKPISPPIVEARIATHLRLKAANDLLRDRGAWLETEVARRTRENEALQDVVVLAMASLGETRDNETGNHLRRTQHYVKCLATQLQAHPRFAAVLTPEAIRLLYKSAPMHDIGKVGIPDAILLKPGKLTADEFEVMKTHTTLGYEAIHRAELSLGHDFDFLRFAKEIALSHQEKWNGSGYPQGLAGEQIPVSARLMALADVYDALISRRVYKPAFSFEQAHDTILAGRGSHFDPDIVDAFVAVEPQFREIAGRFVD
jgi:putative two-component system response regulator